VARVSDATDEAIVPHVRMEVDAGVATITLDRPDVLNAFSAQMGHELNEAFTHCDRTESIRVVVLTGAGRAFCAGADFSNGPAVFGAPSETTTFSADPLRVHPWDVRKPVIAAINGHAVGLGMTMTLQCDLRIIARTAKCGIVQNRRGVMPDLHSHWTLPRIVGHARAAEILLTGKMFTGEDAERWGLANEVLDADEVLPRAQQIAHDIATNVAPVSVAVSKALLWRDPPPTRAEVLQLETDLHLHLMGAADAREGVMAFLEKRDPQWSMRLETDWPTWLDEETTR
jgi:enoyl-CoA hydratase/carnithine racemase